MLALLAVIGRLFDIAARRPCLPRGVSVIRRKLGYGFPQSKSSDFLSIVAARELLSGTDQDGGHLHQKGEDDI